MISCWANIYIEEKRFLNGFFGMIHMYQQILFGQTLVYGHGIQYLFDDYRHGGMQILFRKGEVFLNHLQQKNMRAGM